MTVPLEDSKEASAVLAHIRVIIEAGIKQRMLQKTPHVVLLSRNFYRAYLRQPLARWLLLWLRSKRVGCTDTEVMEYLERGSNSTTPTLRKIKETMSDEHMKMVNLSHDWLVSLLPFILGKINRVSYGLLTKEDIDKAEASNQRMPRARKLLAVPFTGKDVPSRASEFSHPDVVLGLTILSYRYEQMRWSDFIQVVSQPLGHILIFFRKANFEHGVVAWFCRNLY
jgi:hypothetical protein